MDLYDKAVKLYSEFKDRLASYEKNFYVCRRTDNLWLCVSSTNFQFSLEQNGMLNNNLLFRDKRRITMKLKSMVKETKFVNTKDTVISLKGKDVFDLHTRKIRERRIADLCISALPIKYNPKANTAPFFKFLDDVLGEDKKRFIEFIGSFLVGKNNTVGFFITGYSSGVSTLVKCLDETFRGYFSTTHVDSTIFSLDDTLGGFIYTYTRISKEKYYKSNIPPRGGIKNFPQTWTPIYIGSHDENKNNILNALAVDRKVEIFNFSTVFVNNPTKSYEKKINKNILEVLLSNKEGILKVFLEAFLDSMSVENIENYVIINRQPSLVKYFVESKWW